MDPDIEEIYAAAVRFRAADHRYRRLVQMLEKLAEESWLRIRPDAVYFLANNLIDLVATPISVARQQGIALKRISRTTAWRLIGRTCNSFSASAEVAKERERREISSTSALIGLSRVIDELRINDMKIWGRASS